MDIGKLIPTDFLLLRLVLSYAFAGRISHRADCLAGACGGSRNLVGIAIQLSDSEEEEFFVGYPMLISPEKFDFGIERFGCGI